nr:hypothetical protein CFP56_72698 [Quercus suber]
MTMDTNVFNLRPGLHIRPFSLGFSQRRTSYEETKGKSYNSIASFSTRLLAISPKKLPTKSPKRKPRAVFFKWGAFELTALKQADVAVSDNADLLYTELQASSFYRYHIICQDFASSRGCFFLLDLNGKNPPLSVFTKRENPKLQFLWTPEILHDFHWRWSSTLHYIV